MKRIKKWLVVLLAMIMMCTPALNVAAANSAYPTVDMFAKATSIKGMQGASADTVGSYGGLQHSLVNVYLDDAIFSPTSDWAKNGWVKSYEFEGETFYFGEYPSGMSFVENCNNADMSISVVFLVRWKSDQYNNDSSFLIDAASLQGGHNFYAPNADLNTYGGRAIRAYWHFLMEWLIDNGYHIDNFILGNEVNMPNAWHYSGSTDPTTVANKYADAFYWMYDAVRKYTDVSRCSISVDHSWNHNDEGRGITVKQFLSIFDARLQSKDKERNVDWCLSLHLYPALLYDTRIWTHPMGLTTNSSDTQMVDGSNLSAVTNYIRDTYGEEHRIMLTEQGFTNACGAEAQAACLAYTYYAAMYDPMVDAFLINTENAGANLNFGIDGTTAGTVYTKIDNGNATDEQWIANTCLPTIGVSSWSTIIPNYGQAVNKGNKYSGDVVAELTSLKMKQKEDGSYYFAGEMTINESINGTLKVPDKLPVILMKSTDNEERYSADIKALTENTFYFECSFDGLNVMREYVLEVTSGNSKNISAKRSVKVNLSSCPKLAANSPIGKTEKQWIAYYKADGGEMRIYCANIFYRTVNRKGYK